MENSNDSTNRTSRRRTYEPESGRTSAFDQHGGSTGLSSNYLNYYAAKARSLSDTAPFDVAAFLDYLDYCDRHSNDGNADNG
jgi:hypothetical protein